MHGWTRAGETGRGGVAELPRAGGVSPRRDFGRGRPPVEAGGKHAAGSSRLWVGACLKQGQAPYGARGVAGSPRATVVAPRRDLGDGAHRLIDHSTSSQIRGHRHPCPLCHKKT